MRTTDKANSENVEAVVRAPQKWSVFLKVGVAGTIVAILLLGAIHYSNIIPLHRLPRIVTAPFRPPQRADTVNHVKHERARFSFSYPGNWQIDTASEHYNAESFLILDAPRKGQVRLQILDGEIDSTGTAEQIATRFQLPGLRVIERSEFRTWGLLKGDGLTLSGEKLGDPFQVRIFAHSGTAQSLIVWEYWWDGPNSINATGYKLIEDSFRLSEMGHDSLE